MVIKCCKNFFTLNYYSIDCAQKYLPKRLPRESGWPASQPATSISFSCAVGCVLRRRENVSKTRSVGYLRWLVGLLPHHCKLVLLRTRKAPSCKLIELSGSIRFYVYYACLNTRTYIQPQSDDSAGKSHALKPVNLLY